MAKKPPRETLAWILAFVALLAFCILVSVWLGARLASGDKIKSQDDLVSRIRSEGITPAVRDFMAKSPSSILFLANSPDVQLRYAAYFSATSPVTQAMNSEARKKLRDLALGESDPYLANQAYQVAKDCGASSADLVRAAPDLAVCPPPALLEAGPVEFDRILDHAKRQGQGQSPPMEIPDLIILAVHSENDVDVQAVIDAIVVQPAGWPKMANGRLLRLWPHRRQISTVQTDAGWKFKIPPP